MGGREMQGHEPGFMKLGLPDMKKRRHLCEFDIRHSEPEGFTHT